MLKDARIRVTQLLLRVQKLVDTSGETNTMAFLIPQIVDAVDIPVIAAGGRYDGRAAALHLELKVPNTILGFRRMRPLLMLIKKLSLQQ